jgi:hypothetical protein
MGTEEERMSALQLVKEMVDLQRDPRGWITQTISFATCIHLSFKQLLQVFHDDILAVQRLGDETTEKEGKAYWTGTTRRPNPMKFSTDEAMCMEYLYTTANL